MINALVTPLVTRAASPEDPWFSDARFLDRPSSRSPRIHLGYSSGAIDVESSSKHICGSCQLASLLLPVRVLWWCSLWLEHKEGHRRCLINKHIQMDESLRIRVPKEDGCLIHVGSLGYIHLVWSMPFMNGTLLEVEANLNDFWTNWRSIFIELSYLDHCVYRAKVFRARAFPYE